MVETQNLQAPAAQAKSTGRLTELRTSKRWQRAVRLTLSYTILILGAMLMLFPLLWMISASLKPPWQIFTVAIIWIPQQWADARAGTTNHVINLSTVQHDA